MPMYHPYHPLGNGCCVERLRGNGVVPKPASEPFQITDVCSNPKNLASGYRTQAVIETVHAAHFSEATKSSPLTKVLRISRIACALSVQVSSSILIYARELGMHALTPNPSPSLYTKHSATLPGKRMSSNSPLNKRSAGSNLPATLPFHWSIAFSSFVHATPFPHSMSSILLVPHLETGRSEGMIRFKRIESSRTITIGASHCSLQSTSSILLTPLAMSNLLSSQTYLQPLQ